MSQLTLLCGKAGGKGCLKLGWEGHQGRPESFPRPQSPHGEKAAKAAGVRGVQGNLTWHQKV